MTVNLGDHIDVQVMQPDDAEGIAARLTNAARKARIVGAMNGADKQ